MGRVIYSLAQVPSQALIQNLDMCSHSEKHVRGSLHILLLISGAVRASLDRSDIINIYFSPGCTEGIHVRQTKGTQSIADHNCAV